jgi:hypothetical protein
MKHTPRNNASVTRGRPFERGNSGRSIDTRNKTTVTCETLMMGETEAGGLTHKVIELAHSGDSAALRLCMERIYPVRKRSLINLAFLRWV